MSMIFQINRKSTVVIGSLVLLMVGLSLGQILTTNPAFASSHQHHHQHHNHHHHHNNKGNSASQSISQSQRSSQNSQVVSGGNTVGSGNNINLQSQRNSGNNALAQQ